MKFFFDTNIVSEIRLILSGKANPNFVQWLKTVDMQNCWTSVVVFMEIEKGILRKERKDKFQGEHLKIWLETSIKPLFANRILNIDLETAKICASLHIPNPRPDNDAWIAASCIQHNLTLITRNEADFQNLGMKIINPFIAN